MGRNVYFLGILFIPPTFYFQNISRIYFVCCYRVSFSKTINFSCLILTRTVVSEIQKVFTQVTNIFSQHVDQKKGQKCLNLNILTNVEENVASNWISRIITVCDEKYQNQSRARESSSCHLLAPQTSPSQEAGAGVSDLSENIMKRQIQVSYKPSLITPLLKL